VPLVVEVFGPNDLPHFVKTHGIKQDASKNTPFGVKVMRREPVEDFGFCGGHVWPKKTG